MFELGKRTRFLPGCIDLNIFSTFSYEFLELSPEELAEQFICALFEYSWEGDIASKYYNTSCCNRGAYHVS